MLTEDLPTTVVLDTFDVTDFTDPPVSVTTFHMSTTSVHFVLVVSRRRRRDTDTYKDFNPEHLSTREVKGRQ